MTETIRIPVPTVAPLGIPVDRDSLREVWDCYVKPGQDAGNLQSVEERILMAVLRAVYVGLGPTDREPGEFPDLLTDAEGVAVELADCLIRILDTMHSLDVDIDGVVARKMAYNASRPHKHGKAY